MTGQLVGFAQCMCEVVLHVQRSAEVPMVKPGTGQTIFQCPEPVPVQAATSSLY